MLKAKVIFDRDYAIGQVDKRMYGALVEHVGRQIYNHGLYDPLSPLSDEMGMRTDVIQAVRESGVTLMRYPGGNVVSGFNWEDSVGPVEQRPRTIDLGWFSVEPNTFGLNEFVEWSKKAGTDIMYTVNMGTRGMEEAAHVVEYCNLPGGTRYSDMRIAHGWKQPHNIKLWCVGNETDGPWQIGMKTADEYGRLACESGKMMKWLDPSIELVAHGSSTPELPSYPEYTRQMLEHCYDQMDYVALHRYYGNEAANDPEDYLAKTLDLEDYILSTIAAIDYVKAKKRSKKRLHISFDEYNVSNFIEPNEIPVENRWKLMGEHPRFEEKASLEDGLMVAGMLITFLKHADRIKIACMASMVNATGAIMINEKGIYRQTYYYPLMHVATLGRGTAIVPVVKSPRVDTASFTDVPLVDAVAVENEEKGEMTIFALNRSLKEEMALTLDLRGMDRMTAFEHIVMTGPDRKARNTFETPVNIVPFHQHIEPDAEEIKIPAFSWNVIRFKKA